MISEFHFAVGQYINYRTALESEEEDRVLYIAVPTDIYKSFFSLEFKKTVVETNKRNLIIYDIMQEVIVKWQQ